MADVVYIDQPLGTGFSEVGDASNCVISEEMVSDVMRVVSRFQEASGCLCSDRLRKTCENFLLNL